MRLFHRMMRMEKYSTELFTSLQSRDNHNATHVTLSKPLPKEEFESYLKHVIERELEAKSKSVWVHLNRDNLGLLSTVVDHQFKIHHGKEDSVILYRWLSEMQDLVPAFSRFYVGCGAIVIRNECVLVVKEKNGARKDDWGVPGGLCDLNQPIADASIRELYEQTNLKGTYKYMIFFRELENTIHGATDFYFGNLVELPAGEQANLKICERELQDYKWLHLGEVNHFFENHQIKGTQKHLLAYLGELYQKKFRFYEEMPNVTLEHRSTLRGGDKYFKEHRLIP